MENLSVGNWNIYSEAVTQAHKAPSWHKEILKDACRYEKVILDTYWNPGCDNDDKTLFASTFRIDPLFFGYCKGAIDHDGNSVYSLYQKQFDDLDSYMSFIRDLITKRVRFGCISLKNAIAYDRGLDFTQTSRDKAARVFREPSDENARFFQDYFFREVCALGAELDVPIQCHTGLGCLDNTSAIHMRQIVAENPGTRFVLFHGSFPWTDDMAALLHKYSNVYADICWLPLLSPTAAEHALHLFIEIGTSDRICWRCDTWTSEESFGARLAMNSILKNVLEQKIADGYLSTEDAEYIAQRILYDNPKALYRVM